MLRCRFVLGLCVFSLVACSAIGGRAQTIDVSLRYQQSIDDGGQNYHRLERQESWNPEDTAVIVCDMWDSHHCVNAVRRVAELAPRIDAFCRSLRDRGVTIIHAPSSCMDSYEKHPSRLRAQRIPQAASMPPDIASWCDQIPSEERIAYPLDQSQGGEDDDWEEHELWAQRLAALGLNPGSPWQRQVKAIHIDDQKDYISDQGTEIWSVLTARGIKNVVLVGVHTNMCVLGRPFGLRRLASAGVNVVLARDLTDTMYDPRAWPYASHFTGTDLIVSHVERHVCPTISSDQVLGGSEFRFANDNRKRLLVLIAEDEYETDKTLPAFAAKHLSHSFSVSYAFGSSTERHSIIGVEQLEQADALLVSVRRRALPEQHMRAIQNFVSRSKPVIGIRTASHAFSLRGQTPPEGTAVWETFDADVFGGNYTNHYGNDLKATLSLGQGVDHPILASTDASAIHPAGSLYKTAPLHAGSQILIEGSVESDSNSQPVAWTFVRNDGGRSFYTSLGHPQDFDQPQFESLLSAGIHWACGLQPPTLEQVVDQNQRYSAGQGQQR